MSRAPESVRGALPFVPWLVVVVRVALVLILAGELYVTAVIQLPVLVHPTTIGSDTSNYYAAALRLNDGHNLYGPLLPGDRPVPGYPDRYPAPLLSPPLVAVIWRPLALLGDVSMEIWWAANLALVVGLVIWFAVVGRRWTLGGALAVLALGLPIALILSAPYRQPGLYSPVSIAALSGNLNGYVTGLCILTWWAAVSGRSGLAGTAAGLAAVLKLGPFALVWWFVVRHDWPAIKAFMATAGILGIVGLLGAGLDANLAFVGVAFGEHITPTSLSVPWLLEAAFHLHPRLADLGTIVATVVGLAAVFATRRRARLSFLLAIMVVIWSSPVVLTGNLVILLAAAAPGAASVLRGGIDPIDPHAPGGIGQERGDDDPSNDRRLADLQEGKG